MMMYRTDSIGRIRALAFVVSCCILCCTISSGCTQERRKTGQSGAKSSAKSPSPKSAGTDNTCLDRFARFADKLRTELPAAVSEYTKGKGRVVKDVSYDVRKTDSLLSPYEGTISYRVFVDNFTHEWKCFYLLQNDKWTFKSCEFITVDVAGVNPSIHEDVLQNAKKRVIDSFDKSDSSLIAKLLQSASQY